MSTPAEYLDAGWALCQFPRGAKGDSALGKGWNTPERAIRDAHVIQPGNNIGLLHAYSRTASIDVDHFQEAVGWLDDRGVDLTALLCADNAVQIRSGTPNRAKLIYALPDGVEPLETVTVKNDADEVILELRCAARNGNSVQDVLPPSIHPSGRQYEWAGEGDWRNLPALPDELVELWRGLIEPQRQRKPNSRSDGADHSGEVERFIARLQEMGLQPHREGASWRAFCPVHGGDQGTSFKIDQGEDGRVLVHCFAGCSGEATLRAVRGWRPKPPPAEAITLDECHAVFRRWLGDEYDLEALDAVLAAAAAERLGGDPLWLLLISGSGNAKTETCAALAGVGAHIVSTIASEGALLSGSPQKQRAKGATGGLLRQIGERGLLVIKDVTSILSMNRDTRAMVIAALREIHDGLWVRNMGTDGGQTLTWEGRLVIIGAVTTAWDSARDVIAAMGDRFLLLRMDSNCGRISAGLHSRRNVDHEREMRADLAGAVAGVLAGINSSPGDVTDEECLRLLGAADLVTRARTGVDFDYRGNVIDAHAPEMPTRFMKQLVQMARGALAIGLRRGAAMRLAVRCARDSVPPLRLSLIDDLAANPGSTPTEVRRRLGKPRSTVDRQLQALHMLRVLTLDEREHDHGTQWRYTLVDDADPDALTVPSPDLSPHTQ